jgi:hypothetical protein
MTGRSWKVLFPLIDGAAARLSLLSVRSREDVRRDEAPENANGSGEDVPVAREDGLTLCGAAEAADLPLIDIVPLRAGGGGGIGSSGEGMRTVGLLADLIGLVRGRGGSSASSGEGVRCFGRGGGVGSLGRG